MKIPVVVACALFACCLVIWAADPEADETDPWNGKTRAEITEFLGEPAKVKKDKTGGETLTYKFHRIDPLALPQPDAVLLQVPGVGVVARVDKTGKRAPDPMTIDPPQYDPQGRPAGGGVSPTRSSSTSYDTDTGAVTQTSTIPDNPPGGGKVKLRFVLDASGRVIEWSVSGKK